MQRKLVSVFIASVFFNLGACDKKIEASVSEASLQSQIKFGSPFKPTATLQEIMLAIIDPNVDPIWNSISTTVSAEGTEEIRPETEDDWIKLRNHAITLREVSNLLIVEGRKVAIDGASTSIHHSELDPHEIEAVISAHWPAFIGRAHALQDAATLALNAINAKDVDALEAAGSVIEHACEGCHSQFWYPDDRRPIE